MPRRVKSNEMIEQLRREQDLILDAVGEGIYHLDLNGNFVFVNPKGAELVGRDPDELIGKPAHETIHHKHSDGREYSADECPILQTIRQGAQCRITNDVFWRKDGTPFRVKYVSAPMRDENGTVVGAIVVFDDVSKEVAAETRIKLQAEQYRLLFETNPNPMWVFDTRTLSILAVNQAAVAQYGYSRDEFLKLTIKDLRPAEDVPELLKARALSSPLPMSHYSGQFRHKKKDGSTIVVDVYSSPLVWDGVRARIVTGIDVTERKRTGERMQAILDSALDCVITMDHQGRIVEFNPAAEKTFGYCRDEAIGQLLSDLIIPPSLRERHQRGLSHYLATGEAPVLGKRVELSAVRRDGSEFPVELAITRIGTQKPPMFTGFIRDITERKTAEERLRKAEQKYRAIFENSIEGIFQSTPDGKWVSANPALARMYGFSSPEELMAGDAARPYVDPARREQLKQLLEETGFVEGFEFEVYGNDGSKMWLSENARVVRDSEGNVICYEGTVQDITERKRAEERLREQADIINRAQDAVIIRNFDDDRVIFWNKGAEQMYGWSAAEALGRPLGELIFCESSDRDDLVRKLIATGEYHGEIKHRSKDGRELVVDSRVTLIRNDDGTSRAVLGVNTDITEQKKLETQLLRAQRLDSIGTVASGVAHDLNNILTPILMCSQVVRVATTPEQREEAVSLIEESARRGAGIVKQVLTFARGVEGERVLIKPAHLVDEMIEIAKKTFPKTIEISSKYPDDLWTIKGDPTQLHQVLMNLCVNARDAMPNGGALVIWAENLNVDESYAAMAGGAKPGAYVAVRVSDTGLGMPPGVVEKIFDPFFTTKELGKGTGLGLSTALGIVKSHGGFISVYSEVGKGTTFKLCLSGRYD